MPEKQLLEGIWFILVPNTAPEEIDPKFNPRRPNDAELEFIIRRYGIKKGTVITGNLTPTEHSNNFSDVAHSRDSVKKNGELSILWYIQERSKSPIPDLDDWNTEEEFLDLVTKNTIKLRKEGKIE
ncbi:MAG: hypothetical protein LUO97_02175 [Methanomicrobiales archaeon]|nr:hypothetical protein [Methanomicrobiales archaeon]MDD1668585.1 hypothetical protein [Methanomicrobiales archaeon]